MKDNDVNRGSILKRLGIGIHVLCYVHAFIAIIIGIALENPIFIFVSPVVSLILGWGIRWILTGETNNIIPFYEDQKNIILEIRKFTKERISRKIILKVLAIAGILSFFIAGIVMGILVSIDNGFPDGLEVFLIFMLLTLPFIWLYRKNK